MPLGLGPGMLVDRHPTDQGLAPVLDQVQARLLLIMRHWTRVGKSYNLLTGLHMLFILNAYLMRKKNICYMILPEFFLLASNRLTCKRGTHDGVR